MNVCVIFTYFYSHGLVVCIFSSALKECSSALKSKINKSFYNLF